MFLIDTRDGRSERGLVTAALDVVDGGDLHVLVGGLGVGFSLGAALASPLVGHVTVVEVERAVVELVREVTGARTGADLDDPRVEVVVGDLRDVLAETAAASVDVLCLDVDNGPTWTLGEGNRHLYTGAGLDLLAGVLRPGGALAIWSSHDAPAFRERLAARFGEVATHTWAVPRGEPDRVWVVSA